jgi:F420H(2)-dependent quinone reductase
MPTDDQRPARGAPRTTSVGRRVPPQRLVTLANPLVRLAMRTPLLHRLLDAAVLVLHVVGRRTGRSYDIPVGFVTLEGELVVMTQHAWRANLRGVADVEVTHRGRRSVRRVALEEKPAAVAATIERIVDRYGAAETQRRLGLRFRGDLRPSRAELEAAVRVYDLAMLHLAEPAHHRG